MKDVQETHQQNCWNGYADNLVADLIDDEHRETLLPDRLYSEAWSYYLDRAAWCSIPEYVEPKPVSGEIPWK